MIILISAAGKSREHFHRFAVAGGRRRRRKKIWSSPSLSLGCCRPFLSELAPPGIEFCLRPRDLLTNLRGGGRGIHIVSHLRCDDDAIRPDRDLCVGMRCRGFQGMVPWGETIHLDFSPLRTFLAQNALSPCEESMRALQIRPRLINSLPFPLCSNFTGPSPSFLRPRFSSG